MEPYYQDAQVTLYNADCRDVLQNVFISVHRQIRRFEYDPERGLFRNWLITIVLRQINHYESRIDRGTRGIGGGVGFAAFASNSSRNLSTKLWVGHAQASPKAQIVRPAMLSATFTSVFGSSTTPPPSSIRSVIFFIQSEPSRQGVHWPQDSCA